MDFSRDEVDFSRVLAPKTQEVFYKSSWAELNGGGGKTYQKAKPREEVRDLLSNFIIGDLQKGSAERGFPDLF